MLVRHIWGYVVPQVARGVPTAALPPDPDQRTRQESWFSKAREPCSLSLAPDSLCPPPQPSSMPPTPASCHIPEDLPSVVRSSLFVPGRALLLPPCPLPPTHALPSPGCFLPALPAGPRLWGDKTAHPSGRFPAGRRLVEPTLAFLPPPGRSTPGVFLGGHGRPHLALAPLMHLLWGLCMPLGGPATPACLRQPHTPGHPRSPPSHNPPDPVSPAGGPEHSGSMNSGSASRPTPHISRTPVV